MIHFIKLRFCKCLRIKEVAIATCLSSLVFKLLLASSDIETVSEIEGVLVQLEAFSPPIVISDGFAESGRRLPAWFNAYLISLAPHRFSYEEFDEVMENSYLTPDMYESYRKNPNSYGYYSDTLLLEFALIFSKEQHSYVLAVTRSPMPDGGNLLSTATATHLIYTESGWKWFHPEHGIIWNSGHPFSQEELIKLIYDKGLPRIPVNVIPDIVAMNLPDAMVGDAVDIEELLPKPKSTPETSTAANVSAPQSLGTKPELPSPETAIAEEHPAAWWRYLAVALAATGLLFFWLRRKTNR